MLDAAGDFIMLAENVSVCHKRNYWYESTVF